MKIAIVKINFKETIIRLPVDNGDYQKNFRVSIKSIHIEITYSIFTTIINIINVLTSVFADIE